MMGKADIKQPLTKGVAKVPVVMQLEARGCGATSLTMLMAYYGKWVPLEQARSDCGVSRDGPKAKKDGGKIIEDGTYEGLIEQGGFFAELVERQRLDNAS